MSQEVEQNLQERLRLERVRQERLARVQEKRVALDCPTLSEEELKHWRG